MGRVSLTFAPGNHRYTSRATADAEDDWFLDPRYEEMCPFAGDCLQNTTETVKYHSPLSTIN